MEPNANFPGVPQNDPNQKSGSERLTPSFSINSSGSPAPLGGPGQPTPPTSPTPEAPIPPTAPTPPSPVAAEPAKEVPIPPPPVSPAPSKAPEVPTVVNYGLNKPEPVSTISSGAGAAGPQIPPVPPQPAPFVAPAPAVPPPPAAPAAGLGGVTPPPGMGDVAVRTLGSDLEALKSSGGISAQPEVAPAKPSPAVGDLSSKVAGAKEQPPVNPYGFEGGPVFTPQAVAEGAGIKKSQAVSKNTLKYVVIGLAVVVVLGGAAFFLVQKFAGGPKAPIAPAVPTSTPVAQTPTPPPFVHHSFFTTSTAAVSLDLTSLSTASLVSAINAANEATTTPARTVKEMRITLNGAPLETPQALSILLPGNNGALAQYLDNDFTPFLYYDGQNAWPGYVFELGGNYSTSTPVAAEAQSTSTSPSATTTALGGKVGTEPLVDLVKSTIESSPDLVNFYLSSPGTFSQGAWVGGLLPNKQPVRFVRFSAKGTVFEYGWYGKYLILSTSYAGISQAESMLSGS